MSTQASPILSGQVLFATLSFSNITGNNTGDADIGEAQMFVDIYDMGSGLGLADNQVYFDFRNTGPEASSITQIFFDDGTLLGISELSESTGVSYIEDEVPIRGGLPGGNTVSFSADFNVDPSSPVQPNGINPGESLGILFDLINDKTLQDTLKALDPGITDPQSDQSLRIGFHVQGYDSEGSESFVNNPPPIIVVPAAPEPNALALLGLGIAIMSFTGMRNKRI
ncbi:MAG: PEP-CTERM sorting domain-containing protein [Methyloprofundus sp.]|nr:PEP-CTERM sorting domain-containing protein [Methyloprofundus sp.]